MMLLFNFESGLRCLLKYSRLAVTKELCLPCTFRISGEHILAPVLKYILASAVSSYDFPGCPGKFIHNALLFSTEDVSVYE